MKYRIRINYDDHGLVNEYLIQKRFLFFFWLYEVSYESHKKAIDWLSRRGIGMKDYHYEDERNTGDNGFW